jgi:hypothetical protein
MGELLVAVGGRAKERMEAGEFAAKLVKSSSGFVAHNEASSHGIEDQTIGFAL